MGQAMNNAVCRLTGAEFPLFAFSHCRDVVVAVSKAGGFGVLGAAAFSPEQLDRRARLDRRACRRQALRRRRAGARDGRSAGRRACATTRAARRAFRSEASRLRRRSPHPPRDRGIARRGRRTAQRHGITPESGAALMEVAFRHPIRLIANALGHRPAGDDRAGQGARHAGRRAGRRARTCAAPGRGGGRHHRRAGRRGGRALRRGFDAGADPRGGPRAGRGGLRDPGAGGGRDHDRRADGGDDGDRRARAHGPAASGSPRPRPRPARSSATSDDRRAQPRHGPFAQPHRQARAPAALGLARGVGRAGQPRRAADAADGHGLRTRLRPDRTRRRGGQRRGARGWSATSSARVSGWSSRNAARARSFRNFARNSLLPCRRWWIRSTTTRLRVAIMALATKV